MSNKTFKWVLGMATSAMQVFWLIGVPILGIAVYQKSSTTAIATAALFDGTEWARDPYRNVTTLLAIVGMSVVWAVVSGLLVWATLQAAQLKRQRRYGIVPGAGEIRGWRKMAINASAFSLLMPLVGALMMAAPVGAAELPATDSVAGAAAVDTDPETVLGATAPAIRDVNESVWGVYAATEAQHEYAIAPLVAATAQDQPNPIAAPEPGDGIPSWYTVSEGETLSSIASVTLGSEGRWRAIRDVNVGALMNNGSRFDETLQAGWTIQLPADANPETADWSPLVPSTHVVTRGDHFWGIAADTLSDTLGRGATTEEIGPYWQTLIDENQDNLMAPYDPGVIYPGQVMYIPPPAVEVVEGTWQVAYEVAAPQPDPVEVITVDTSAAQIADMPTRLTVETSPAPSPEAFVPRSGRLPAAVAVAAPAAVAADASAASPATTTSLWSDYFAETDVGTLASSVRAVASTRQVASPQPATTVDAPVDATVASLTQMSTAPTSVDEPAVTPIDEPAVAAVGDTSGGPWQPHWMLLGAGLTAVAAAIAVWHLRRRRTRRIARWMGEDEIGAIVELEPETVAAVKSVELSAELGPVSGMDALGLIDAANRQWTRALGAAGRTAPIRTVRVTTGTIEIGVEPFIAAPDCWSSHPSGLGWFLRKDIRKADLISYAGEQASVAYAPTLVPVGEAEEGTILVDIERAGVIAVEGWDRGREALLRSVGESLAAAPWSDGVKIVTIDVDVPCGPGWERVRPLLAGSDELDELIASSDRLADPDARSGYEIRIAGDVDAERSDLPTVVIVGTGHDDLSRRLCQLALRASSRLVVVTASHAPIVPWRLAAHSDGTVVLEPMGHRMMIGAPLPEEVPAAVAAASTRVSVDALTHPADFEAFLDEGMCPEHADIDSANFMPVLAEYEIATNASMEAYESGGVTAYASAGAATAVIDRPPGDVSASSKAEALYDTVTRRSVAHPAPSTPVPPATGPEHYTGFGGQHEVTSYPEHVAMHPDDAAHYDDTDGPHMAPPEPRLAADDALPAMASTHLEHLDATHARIAQLAERGILDVTILEPAPLLELRTDPSAQPQECESPAISAAVRDTLMYLVLCRGTSPRGDAIDTLRIAGEWRHAWATMRRRISSINDLAPVGVELATYAVSDRNEVHMNRREPFGFTEYVTSDWKRFCDYTAAADTAPNDDIRRAYLRAAMAEVGRFPLADTAAVDWWRDGVIMSNIVEADIAAAGVALWKLETARGDHPAAAHCAERLRVANPYADVAYLFLLQSYGELNDWDRIRVVFDQYSEMVKATELPHEVDGDGPSPAILQLYETLASKRRDSDGAAKRHARQGDAA